MGVDASKVDIAELGELAVIVDGETQVIVGAKTRLVLALLSLKQPEAVTVDHLLDTVWPPPEQPSSARQSLSNVIHRLRQVIGADSILTAGNTYRLAPGIHSHRTELLALPAAIRAMLDDGHADRAAELAERALRTWRGEPWSGLDDVGPVLADRVVLEASRLEIEGLAARAAAALGEWTAARDAWDRMVAVRPYQESWWCSAAEAREQLGDRVEALRVLRRARASLDQAGVLPGPRLVAMEQRLLGEGGRPAGTPSETEVDEPALVDRRATPSLLVAEKTSFIGRTRELDRLVTARRRPDASTPRVSFVAGPAGIGKSRLAVEAARRCAAHVVLCGRSEQGSESTLGPFRQILDEYASSVTVEERHRDAGPSGAALGVRLNSFADLAPSAETLAPAVEDTAQLVDGVVDLLLAASRRRPLLLVLDDLQWASATALDVMRHLVTRSSPDALTMIATYRPSPDVDDARTQRLTELTALPGCDDVELHPLAVDEVASLVDAADVMIDADELHRRSGGNPFYLAELLEQRSDEDRGTLFRLITTRASRLHPEALHHLRLAALSGLDVDAALIASASELPARTVDAVVEALTATGFLLRGGGGHRLQFAHGIVAEAVLQTLSDDRRCRLHLELAIAQQRSGRPATDTIAHLLGAGPLVEASTLAACAQEAGETLVRHGDARTAARIMRDVLANSLPPSIEVSAKRVLGVALLALSDPEAYPLLIEAHEAAVRLGLDQEIVNIALVYSTGGAWRRNADRNGPRMLRIALDRCPPDQAELRERLRARLEAFEIFSSTLAGRLESTGRALADARASGRPKLLAEALNARLLAVSCPATLSETARLEAEIRQLEDAGLAHSELANRPGMSTYWRGDGARYRADIAQRRSDLANSHLAQRVLFEQLAACTAIHDGELAAARTHNDSLVDESRWAVYDVQKGNHLWNSTMIEWLAGDPSVVASLAKQRYDEMRGGPLRYTLLWLAAESGWHDEVAELRPNATPERIARLPELFLGGFGLAALALAARRLHDERLAMDVRPHLIGLSDQMIGVPWATYPAVDFFLGVVDALLGDRPQAIGHFERANDVHRRMLAPAFVELTERELAALG